MDPLSGTKTGKPNKQLLALFSPQSQKPIFLPKAPKVPPGDSADDESFKTTQSNPAYESPSVTKFMKYSQDNKGMTAMAAYPPYGLATMLKVPAPVSGEKRGQSGAYKNQLFAQCYATAEAALGTVAAKSLCFRCKGTKEVCNGASACIWKSENYLARTSANHARNARDLSYLG